MIRYEIQAVELLVKNLMKEAKRLLQTTKFPMITKKYINEGRYCILSFSSDTETVKYGILFKKERIHSFGEIFKKKGEQGEGESVNVYDFKRYFEDCNKGGMIYVYQNTWSLEAYKIYPLAIKRLAGIGKVHEYINKNDGKKELWFSVKFLERLDFDVPSHKDKLYTITNTY